MRFKSQITMITLFQASNIPTGHLIPRVASVIEVIDRVFWHQVVRVNAQGQDRRIPHVRATSAVPRSRPEMRTSRSRFWPGMNGRASWLCPVGSDFDLLRCGVGAVHRDAAILCGAHNFRVSQQKLDRTQTIPRERPLRGHCRLRRSGSSSPKPTVASGN